jgi:coenzyme F420-reducing hydrogenase delta subunit
MTKHQCADVFIYVCHNCLPDKDRLPRQWRRDDLHVRVVELPCTGKINTQYLFHALEGGSAGLCVITCPQGECTLFEGNYRAEMRVNNVKSLLQEIGMDPARVKILSSSPRDSLDELKRRIDAAITDFSRVAAGVVPAGTTEQHEV